jgi:cytochrome c553
MFSNRIKLISCLFLIFFICQPVYAQSVLDKAFNIYKGTENLSFDANRGKELWNKKRIDEAGKERTCHTCHTKDLTQAGKHIKTGKKIEPLAPSVNNERFTELKKIKKWFKRNCKWTFGRECTNQEKGDILTYLSQL